VSKSLADFLPEILPQVPGCGDLLAKNAVRNALIEFCERTEVWRVELDPIMVVNGVSDYELDPPDSKSVIWRVMNVSYDGMPIDPKTTDDLDAEKPGWRTETGTPFAYFAKDIRRTLRLVYTPDADLVNGLVIEAALKPSKTATTVEDALFEEYFDDVAEGALAKLFGIENHPWSSAAKAKYHRDKFDTMISTFSVEGARHGTRAPLRTKPYYSL